MTEQHFPHPIQSFSLGSVPTPLDGPINILEEGRPALEKANQELGKRGSLGGRPSWAAGVLRLGKWWPETNSHLFLGLAPRSGPGFLGPGFLHQTLPGAAAEP